MPRSLAYTTGILALSCAALYSALLWSRRVQPMTAIDAGCPRCGAALDRHCPNPRCAWRTCTDCQLVTDGQTAAPALTRRTPTVPDPVCRPADGWYAVIAAAPEALTDPIPATGAIEIEVTGADNRTSRWRLNRTTAEKVRAALAYHPASLTVRMWAAP